MAKEWELLLENVYEEQDKIDKGEAVKTEIFDRETYEIKYISAIISKDPAKLPDGEKLWVRNLQGHLEPEPWAIQILEELDKFWFDERRS